MSIADKLLKRLGRAIESSTSKSDLYISERDLYRWYRLAYAPTMLSMGKTLDDTKDIYDSNGMPNVTKKNTNTLLELYSSAYIMNMQKPVIARHTKTGISVVGDADIVRIPTQLRRSDRLNVGATDNGVDDFDDDIIKGSVIDRVPGVYQPGGDVSPPAGSASDVDTSKDD